MKKISAFIVVSLLIVAGVFAFVRQNQGNEKTMKNNAEHQLIVSVLPQKQIVQKIAGEKFAVNELIPPGFSPATYDPTVEEMKIVANSEIYFRIGHIPFEETNIEKLTDLNPTMLVVDTSKNNTLRNLEAHTHGEEDEHEEDEHDHDHEEGIDPHVWLSPVMVQEQATVIYESLTTQYPEYANQFSANYEVLIKDLEELDEELAVAFAPIKGKTMLVYHPAFGYLARDYGFTQEHIEIEGKEPSIDDIQNIIDEAKEDDARVIFVQKQFSQDSAKAIADSIGGVVVEVDPLAEDYFANMKSMAKTITDSL
jgi:zinc transport system substrate-binding protein